MHMNTTLKEIQLDTVRVLGRDWGLKLAHCRHWSNLGNSNAGPLTSKGQLFREKILPQHAYEAELIL